MKKAIGVRSENSSWCTEVILEAQKGRETVERQLLKQREVLLFFFLTHT